MIAFVVRGWTGPVLVLVVVVVSAVRANVLRGCLPYLLTVLPFVVSVTLIHTFLSPRAQEVLFSIGPFEASREGLTDGLQTSLRVAAFALAVAVFVLTTTAHELASDLEGRGLGRRASFVLGASIGLVPRLLERAREITEAQRSRGLDTEGGILRRARGVVPLAGPLVIGALNEVEERTMALEARGISAPGRRTVLRAHPPARTQRLLRWALVVLTALVLAASAAGWLARLP